MTLIETERLALRHFALEDVALILELLNEPGFIRNIGDRAVHTPDAARAYLINGPLSSYERHGFGLWRLALKESDTPIGMCGLIKRDTLEDVDLGYALLERYWRKGYAFEAAQAVKVYARRVLSLKRIVAIVNPENQPSIHVLEKLGMRYERMVSLSEGAPLIKLFALDLSELPGEVKNS